MLSNLLSQLKQAGKEDQLQDVLNEVPRVREDSGYPPLVTPTSQIVGSMSVLNVALGRYKMIPREVKDLILGKYGRTPGPIDLRLNAWPSVTHRKSTTVLPTIFRRK